MADIDVVPRSKSGSGWVLWLVLAIVAIVIAWMLFGRDGTNQTGQLVPPAPVTAAATTPVSVAVT